MKESLNDKVDGYVLNNQINHALHQATAWAALCLCTSYTLFKDDLGDA